MMIANFDYGFDSARKKIKVIYDLEGRKIQHSNNPEEKCVVYYDD
jgi:hypothetical protein